MRAVGYCLVLLWPLAVWANDGARRDEVEAPVHQPVLTRAPELLEFSKAEYPPGAMAEGKTASVRLLVVIDETGAVAQTTVPEPVGDGFDEAATEAVRRFRFSPAEIDGVPGPVQIEYVYHFTLEPPPPEEAPAAPAATLMGRLLARGSRSMVEGGTVRCGDSADAQEATSDAEGRFRLEVPAGTCEVRVVAQGYRLFRAEEVLEPGQTTEVEFFLMPEAVGYETVVRGSRDRKEVVRRSLSKQELTKIPGTFGDPLRVVQNLPGVARAPSVAGFLLVRGANPNQTLTFIDGVEVPLIFHLGGGPSILNPEFIERIDFYPGGFGARYGRAVGGIVEAATKKGATDTLHGSVEIDLLDAGFFLEAPLAPGISIAAAGRRSYVDALLPWAIDTFVEPDPEGGTLSVVPVYYDYQLRLDLGARGQSSGSTGSVMAFGSDDQLAVAATGSGRNQDVALDVHTLFHRLKGDWTYRSGGFGNRLVPYLGYDLANLDFGQATFRADVFTAGLRDEAELMVNEHLTLRGGADVVYEHGWGETQLPVAALEYVPFPGSRPVVELETVSSVADAVDAALFVEGELKLGPVQVIPGLRGTWIQKLGAERTALDPRLYARWQVARSTLLKGSLGLYSQAPDATSFFDAPFGNPQITFERAFQTSLGVEHRFTEVLNLDVTGFYNRRFDLLVRPGRVIEGDDGSVTREALSNEGLGRAYGVEVMLRHEVTRDFFGWVAYTLSRSEVRLRGEPGYEPAAFDQSHILTAVGSYRLPWWGLEIGGRFRHSTGRPTVGLIGGADLYRTDGNAYTGTFTDPLARRFRAFNQLDLRVDKSFVFDRWTLTVYLDVQNVLNAQNVEGVIYDYRFRNSYEIAGLPILPVVGVKGSF